MNGQTSATSSMQSPATPVSLAPQPASTRTGGHGHPARQSRSSRVWLRVLGVGLFLFGLGAWVLAASGNVHLVPSVLLIAALLVPVTFVVYLHGRMPGGGIPVPTLVLTALVGGILGVTLATLFESAAMTGLGLLPVLAIGLIEEAVKLLAPTVAMLRGRRTQADAVLLGVASGLGFATFETLGYAFAELIRSEGQVPAALTVLLARALLAPAGHAAWTGVTAVAVWRLIEARRAAPFRAGGTAVALFGLGGSYGLAVVLHATWNLQLGVVVSVLVAAISLLLLRRQLRRSRELPDPGADQCGGSGGIGGTGQNGAVGRQIRRCT